ncbi:hypothetical protein ACHAWC_001981 [Mediolabrus comicus]
MVPRRRMVANTRGMETQYCHMCILRFYHSIINF